MSIIDIYQIMIYNLTMKWMVQFSNKANKQVKQLSTSVEAILRLLVEDLSHNGPFPGEGWPNYGRLNEGKKVDKRHCHLKKGSQRMFVVGK